MTADQPSHLSGMGAPVSNFCFTSNKKFLGQWGVGTDIYLGAIHDGDQCIAIIAKDGLTIEEATSNAVTILRALNDKTNPPAAGEVKE